MKVEQTCVEAQRASRVLAGLPRARKDEALSAVADALRRRSAEILAENDEDVRLARENRLADALVDRLLLDEDRLRDVESAVRDVAALPDPVGELVDGWRLDNGVELRKVRVPLGVIAVIYEARPNVTVDAAALCLKSGNAVILRGGSAALHTNRILAEVVQGAVIETGLPREAVSYLGPDRKELAELLKQRKYVDLVIPRGGEDLKEYLLENSKVPVIYAAGGNCHVYVDAAADLEKALPIIVNSKCQRPGVCNAAETLLVHQRGRGRVPAHGRRRSSNGEASSSSWTRSPATSSAIPRSSAPTRRTTTPSSWSSSSRSASSTPSTRRWTTSPPTARGTPRPSSPRTWPRRGGSPRRWTPPASTSTRPPGSPTAASSVWAPRWASPRRSCTSGARSRCRSSPASSTSCGATGRCGARPVAAAQPRLGVLGGSFDPPHLAHLAIASEACHALGLGRVLFVPAAAPPHKGRTSAPSAEVRLEMTSLAIDDDLRFTVSGIEIERGLVYSADMLRALSTRYADHDLVFIMGSRLAAAARDLARAGGDPLAVLSGGGAAAGRLAGGDRRRRGALGRLPGRRCWTCRCMDIASSDIRERAAQRRPIRYLVPHRVEQYILETGLYR